MRLRTLAPTRRLLAVIGLAGALSLAAADAWAKRTLVDFGMDNNPPSNNVQGEAWTISSTQCTTSATLPASCVLPFSSETNSGAVSIGFNVNINGTKYSTLFVNKNGIVTFATGLGAFVAATDFTDLTNNVVGASNPFIAAFYPSSELVIPDASAPSDLGFAGGAEFGRGTANPAGTDNGNPTDLSHNVAAFKATWSEDGSGAVENPVVTRIVIYNTSATGADGDFDLRIEYGLNDGTVYNAGSGKNGIVGFRLGSDTNQVITSASSGTPTAVGSDTDYYYHFCSGKLSVTACTKAPPPERCDVNHDGQIDARDITLILLSFGRHVSATDPRDADGNRIVNFTDAVICARRCTHPYCALK